MTGDYDGAVVIVTGASTGLGRAIAIGAAARGARTVIVNYANSAAQAEETAAAVRAHGAAAVPVRGDVGEDADCRRIVAAAAGRVDALFNNAGTTRPGTPADADRPSAEDFLAVYRTNVVGAYQMSRAARAALEAAGAGAIVNTSSLAGATGQGSAIAYTASKGALNVMTRSLALALAPRIRVNAICPGFIDTPWFDKADMPGGAAALRARMSAAAPLQTVSTPDQVAAAALFLGSAAAATITGETLLIDAGMHLGMAAR